MQFLLKDKNMVIFYAIYKTLVNSVYINKKSLVLKITLLSELIR